MRTRQALSRLPCSDRRYFPITRFFATPSIRRSPDRSLRPVSGITHMSSSTRASHTGGYTFVQISGTPSCRIISKCYSHQYQSELRAMQTTAVWVIAGFFLLVFDAVLAVVTVSVDIVLGNLPVTCSCRGQRLSRDVRQRHALRLRLESLNTRTPVRKSAASPDGVVAHHTTLSRS